MLKGCHQKLWVRRLRTKQKQGAPLNRTHPEKSTCDSDMYNRAFPVGNALFFFTSGVMSLFRLPCSKLPLAFLAVPAGKDGRIECPCQTVNDFIGIRGSVCGLFLFVQTHAPLTIRRQLNVIVPDASFLYESRKFYLLRHHSRHCD